VAYTALAEDEQFFVALALQQPLFSYENMVAHKTYAYTPSKFVSHPNLGARLVNFSIPRLSCGLGNGASDQTCCGAKQAHCSMEMGSLALGMNGPVREAQHSPPHPNVPFTLWCLITHRDNLNSALNT
jgi:hypothetical protein